MTIHAKKIYSQICCIVLRVLQTSKEFWVFSVNHLGGPLRKHMFTCDWCIFIHFVCFCVSRFVALDHPFSGNSRSVFFEDFSNLSYSCLVQEKGNAYLLPSTKIPLIIANSFAILEQSRVIRSFVFAGQAGRARCIVICINPTHAQMIDGTENLFEVCKRAGRYNEFGCKLRWLNTVLSVIEYISFAKSW